VPQFDIWQGLAQKATARKLINSLSCEAAVLAKPKARLGALDSTHLRSIGIAERRKNSRRVMDFVGTSPEKHMPVVIKRSQTRLGLSCPLLRSWLKLQRSLLKPHLTWWAIS